MSSIKIIRAMPNTPMQVGEGCTVYTPGRYVTHLDLEKIHLILNTLGIAQQVPEKMINSVGGLTGCGPAYVTNIQCLFCQKKKNIVFRYFRFTQ